MDHNQYQEQISQLVDNELSGRRSPKLFAHLSTCGECRQFLQKSLQLRSRIVATPPPELSAKLRHSTWNSRVSHGLRITSIIVPTSSRAAQLQMQLPAFVLMLFMLIVGGLLFSTKVEIQRPQESISSTSGLPFANSSSTR